MTAVPKRLLRILDQRDGHRCAWHRDGACDTATLVPHHRQNRGMGGSPNGNSPSNLVWLCAEVNGLLESDAAVARVGLRRGVKVPRNARYSAALVPIDHAVHGWCTLTDEGAVVPVLEATALELLAAYGMRSWEEGVPA